MHGILDDLFVDDDDWHDVLDASFAVLRPGGHLVFETRDPDQQAWEGWTPDASFQKAKGPDGSMVGFNSTFTGSRQCYVIQIVE